MTNAKNKCIIFDFDGTVADSKKVVFGIVNVLLQQEGRLNLDEESFNKLRDMSSLDILKSFNVPWWKLPFLIRKARRMMREKMADVFLIAGMDLVLHTLKERGYVLILLTSNAKENTRSFLERHELLVFDGLYCGVGLFGKARVFKKVIKKYNLVAEEVYSVGDETRDIEAAKEVGFKSVGVTWGLASKNILEKFKPDYVVEKPEELLKIF